MAFPSQRKRDLSLFPPRWFSPARPLWSFCGFPLASRHSCRAFIGPYDEPRQTLVRKPDRQIYFYFGCAASYGFCFDHIYTFISTGNGAHASGNLSSFFSRPCGQPFTNSTFTMNREDRKIRIGLFQPVCSVGTLLGVCGFLNGLLLSAIKKIVKAASARVDAAKMYI